jgi:hypothetical protein
MEDNEPQSRDEVKLRQWLSDNDVYPGNEDMQSLVLNSFYNEFEEDEPNDADHIPLDEVDLDALGIGDGLIIGPTKKATRKRNRDGTRKSVMH